MLVACVSSQAQPLPHPGENATLLVDPGGPALPLIQWSPAGNELAISEFDHDRSIYRIYIYDIDNNQLSLLIDTSDEAGYAIGHAWSPDGKQLVYKSLSRREYHDGFWVIDVSGKQEPKFLTEGIRLAWSPIGEMAIVRKDLMAGVISIHVHEPETGRERLILAKPGTTITKLSWSPDGTYLVFTVGESKYSWGDIYILNTITEELVRLTSDGINSYSVWSPEGDMIAYIKTIFTTSPRTFALYLMRSDGSCSLEVPGVGEISDLAWSPSGKQISVVGWGGVYLVDLVEVFGNKFLAEEFPCNVVE